MASFVAFLRGINVSNRRVTSADLCAPFGSVGLDGATAFRASGNVVFDGRELYWLPSAGTQKSDLDWKAIEAALGVGTMRTIGTVEQIAAKFFG